MSLAYLCHIIIYNVCVYLSLYIYREREIRNEAQNVWKLIWVWFLGWGFRPQPLIVHTDCQALPWCTLYVKDTPGTLGLHVELLDTSCKATRGIPPVAEDPIRRERGPGTMLFPGRLAHWSRRLSESTFRIDRIKYYKEPHGVKDRKSCFRLWLLTKIASDQKSKILLENRMWAFRLGLLSLCKVPNRSGVFAYGISQHQDLTQSRKSHLTVESGRFSKGWCRSAGSSIRWRFGKWRFRLFGHCTLRLVSFCKAEHTHALQKVAFPSFGALHASLSKHRPASCLFTYVIASCSAGPCMPTYTRYETHAAQNLGIREQSCNQNEFAKSVSNLLCFTVCIHLSLSLSLSLYILICIYTHTY